MFQLDMPEFSWQRRQPTTFLCPTPLVRRTDKLHKCCPEHAAPFRPPWVVRHRIATSASLLQFMLKRASKKPNFPVELLSRKLRLKKKVTADSGPRQKDNSKPKKSGPERPPSRDRSHPRYPVPELTFSAPPQTVHQVRECVAAGRHVRIVGPSCGGRIGAVMQGACKRQVMRTLVLVPTREATARAAKEAIAAYPSARIIQDGGKGLVQSDQNPVRSAKRAHISVLVGTPRAVHWSFSKHENGPDWISQVDLLVISDPQLMCDAGCAKQLRYLVRGVLQNKPQVVVIFDTNAPEVLHMIRPAVLPIQDVILWVEQTPRIVRDVNSVSCSYICLPSELDIARALQPLILQALEKCPSESCKVIVFFLTGRITQMYAACCRHLGMDIIEVHSNKTPRHRSRAMATFRERQRPVMFASDMAARGSEIDSVSHIFHVGLPLDLQNFESRLQVGSSDATSTVVLRDYEMQAFHAGEISQKIIHTAKKIHIGDSSTYLPESAETIIIPSKYVDESNMFADVLEPKVRDAAYFAWVAHHAGKLTVLNWSKADLLRQSAEWIRTEIGSPKPPQFQRHTAKHLFLLRVEGLDVASVKIPKRDRAVRRQAQRNMKKRVRAAAAFAKRQAKAKAKKEEEKRKWESWVKKNTPPPDEVYLQ